MPPMPSPIESMPVPARRGKLPSLRAGTLPGRRSMFKIRDMGFLRKSAPASSSPSLQLKRSGKGPDKDWRWPTPWWSIFITDGSGLIARWGQGQPSIYGYRWRRLRLRLDEARTDQKSYPIANPATRVGAAVWSFWPKNEKRPRILADSETPEQPSPEVCSQTPYD